MRYFDTLDRSANLVQGMAERLGIDLMRSDAIQAEVTQFRSLVLNCSRCAEQGACTTLQADNSRLEQAPDYCRNFAGFTHR